MKVNVTPDLINYAIRRLFAAYPQGSIATIAARKLYRAWEATGLRREDLSSGIRALTESGELVSGVYAGNCAYRMAPRSPGKRGRPRNDAFRAVPEFEAGLELLAHRSQAAASGDFLPRREDDYREPRTRPAAPPAASAEASRTTPNRLLAGLPERVFDRIAADFGLDFLKAGEVLWEAGELLRYAYFPVDCIVSLVQAQADGGTRKVAVVGNDGMLGISAVLGGLVAPSRAVVFHEGFAYRYPIAALIEEFECGGAFHHLLQRYSQAFLMQVTQNASCERHHTVEQQLCRLLLSCADQVGGGELKLTLHALGGLFNADRTSFAGAIARLRRDEAIDIRRDDLALLDRQALGRRACECSAIVETEMQRLRPAKSAGRRRAARTPGKIYVQHADPSAKSIPHAGGAWAASGGQGQ